MQNPNLSVSTDISSIDIAVVHQYLSEESYWAKGRNLADIQKSIQNSICFSLLLENRFVGFARVITDRTVFAYLCDVFVLPEFQGKGFGKFLMDAVMAHQDVQTVKRFLLATSSAADFYVPYGFDALPEPDFFRIKIAT